MKTADLAVDGGGGVTMMGLGGGGGAGRLGLGGGGGVGTLGLGGGGAGLEKLEKLDGRGDPEKLGRDVNPPPDGLDPDGLDMRCPPEERPMELCPPELRWPPEEPIPALPIAKPPD